MPLHPFLVRSGLYKTLQSLTRSFFSTHKYMRYLGFVAENKGKGLINDYYNQNAAYPQRFGLHNRLLEDLKDTPIFYYEFGVAGGDMIRHWSSTNTSPNSRFVGFDSFEGLPEGWESKGKRHFDQKGNFPDIQDDRVRFVKGWFQNSVYAELQNCEFHEQCVFHLDADLFSSTLYVLFHLHPKLKSGDILIFDEFSSHEHEYEALEIFKQCINDQWEFEFMGAVNNYRQVAFRLK